MQLLPPARVTPQVPISTRRGLAIFPWWSQDKCAGSSWCFEPCLHPRTTWSSMPAGSPVRNAGSTVCRSSPSATRPLKPSTLPNTTSSSTTSPLRAQSAATPARSLQQPTSSKEAYANSQKRSSKDLAESLSPRLQVPYHGSGTRRLPQCAVHQMQGWTSLQAPGNADAWFTPGFAPCRLRK